MNSYLVRILSLCVIVGLLSAATVWLQSGYIVNVRPSSRDLVSLPVTLGEWQGANVSLDDEVAKFVGAEMYVSRNYQDSSGREVAIYAAVWSDDSIVNDCAPHHPTICYPNAGWTVVKTKELVIDTPDGKLPLSFSEMSKAGNRVVTAHWYQLGTAQYNHRNQGRLELRRLWGQREWPPLMKVLLQTSAASIEDATPDMERFAKEVNSWTRMVR